MKNIMKPIEFYNNLLAQKDYSSFTELTKSAEGACSQLVITSYSMTEAGLK